MCDQTLLLMCACISIFSCSFFTPGFAGKIYDKCDRHGILITGEDEGIIQSENYPNMYPSNQFCKWNIRMQPSQTIVITLVDVDLDDTEAKDHCVEYLSIFNPHNKENHVTECGQVNEQKSVNVDNNTVEIWFHSSPNHTIPKRGFVLQFQVAGCEDIDSINGTTLERNGNVTSVTCDENDEVHDIFCIGTTWHPTPHPIICKDLPIHSDCQSEPVNIADFEGYIHSPNFPTAYPPDKLCVWRLGDQSRRKLHITIVKLSLTATEYSSDCRDYLGIYELTRGDPVTEIHCHNLAEPVKVDVDSGLVDILFESRERPPDKPPGDGFLIKYEAIGCDRLHPPGGATMVQDPHRTVITCASGKQFIMDCINRQWSPPFSSFSCYISGDTTPTSEIPFITSRNITVLEEQKTIATTIISSTKSKDIPNEQGESEKERLDSEFPLQAVIIGICSTLFLLLIVVIIILVCRRRKKNREEDNKEEDTVQIYTEGDCENEPRPDTELPAANGSQAAPNGHLITQVHYVRPNKNKSKKNKDSSKSKRTSYHLTVADDESAIIENQHNSGLVEDT